MKKIMLLLIICMTGVVQTALAQTLDDFVDEVRGDTLVIKSYVDMEQSPNSIINAVDNDTDAPDGRVYELKRNGWYPLFESFDSPSDRHLQIVGSDPVPMVGSTQDDGFPPVISGYTDGETSVQGDLFNYNGDVTVKHVAMVPAEPEGTVGYSFFQEGEANNTVTLENVMMEHNNWIFVRSNSVSGTSLHISDSYFVNMVGETCRRNGGIYDNVSNNTESIRVENSTHVMAAGVLYKFRSFPVNEVFFNHNTFVNISSLLFATWGNQSNFTVANNLFVNVQAQAYTPGLDYGEFDRDYLPHGIINVDSVRTSNHDADDALTIDASWIETHYPDVGVENFGPEQRKVLVSHNGIYWDDRLDEAVQALNDQNIPCPVDDSGSDCLEENSEWVSQKITMNSRTQAMFDDDETWPFLTEGPWIEGGDPQFTDEGGLMDEGLDYLIDWSINTIASPGASMQVWRAEDNPVNENFVFSDWPIAANLSYSNSQYLTAALGGFPLGDLNWYPDEKQAWLAQRDTEHDELNAALNEGRVPGESVSVENPDNTIPSSIQLAQNYPNPFNPSTTIQYEVSTAADIEVVVYNALGRKVATLVNNEFHQPGEYNIQFDASNLSSGTYFYRLTANGIIQSRKMTLIK